jgi:FkbM family methyltransferase
MHLMVSTSVFADGLPVNSRLSWLAEINERALAARPVIQPGYKPRPISVHDYEYSKLVMSHPFYGFVGAVVGNIELLMYSSNDDNVARTYFYYGADAYEMLSLRLWQRLCQDASCILDIGAFTGLYSLVARGTNDRSTCIAFEPMPHIRHRARMNFVLNGRTGSILLEPFALSDATRMLPFYTSVGPTMLDSGGTVTQRSNDDVVSVDLVQGISLDQYLVSKPDLRPDLLKIDVEFHEVAVLAGARQILTSNRPTIIVEVSKQQTLLDVLSVLGSLGYQMFSVDEVNCMLHEHKHGVDMASLYDAVEDVHNLLACPTLEAATLCQATAAAIRG